MPRNPEILANGAAESYDLGLCGPLRKDQGGNSQLFGLFKTPTLQNVTTRSAFFHNGRFHTLREALCLCPARRTDPQEWYPADRAGKAIRSNDLPAALRKNVDVIDEPLTRSEGPSPRGLMLRSKM